MKTSIIGRIVAVKLTAMIIVLSGPACCWAAFDQPMDNGPDTRNETIYLPTSCTGEECKTAI